MASRPDVIKACMAMASDGARVALEKSIDDAITAMQIAQSLAVKMVDRELFETASKDLARYRVEWPGTYASQLLLVLTGDRHASKSKSPGSAPQIPTSKQATRPALALVDDQTLSESIASARLLQHMLPHVEQSLPDLDKLISAALGLTRVQPDLNPLRPDVFAHGLLDLMCGASAPPEVMALWIKHLSAPFGRELSGLYERVVNLLELAHVRGANYRVSRDSREGREGRDSRDRHDPSAEALDTPGRQLKGGSSASQAPLLQDTWHPDAPETGAGSLQAFLAQGTGHTSQSVSAAFRARMHGELAAQAAALEAAPSAPMLLSDPVAFNAEPDQCPPTDGTPSAYRQLPVVDRPARAITPASALNTQVWGRYAAPKQRALVHTQLKAEAQQVGQVMGMEVVRQLVNQVAQDSRLLAPVRESIVALEPALMRLSMVEPRFFSDEKHPGRQLMERVAQRSFKFNDEFSPEFNTFFKPLSKAFNALNSLEAVDSARFDTVLAALEKHWSAQDTAEATRQRDILERMRFAEARQTQADEIAYSLSSRSDLDEVPGLVLDFLFGPWSLAMAHARLLDPHNQIDPEGLGAAVPDLLWSAKSHATLKQPAKLIQMIPGLLGKLNSGLQLLGTDPQETAPFFDGLMKLHQPVLKLRRVKSKRDAQASSHTALSETASLLDELAPADDSALSATQHRAKGPKLPWMAKADMAAAGFEDTLPTDHSELVAPDEPIVQSAEGPTPRGSPALQSDNEPTLAAPIPDNVLTRAEAPADATPDAITDAPANVSPPTTDAVETVTAEAMQQAQNTLAALTAGDWVDLYSRRRWLRAQLTWASNQGTLFMFVSHGGQPHSMTKRSCERLIAARLLRPVNTHGVVARALSTVVAQASAAP